MRNPNFTRKQIDDLGAEINKVGHKAANTNENFDVVGVNSPSGRSAPVSAVSRFFFDQDMEWDQETNVLTRGGQSLGKVLDYEEDGEQVTVRYQPEGYRTPVTATI